MRTREEIEAMLGKVTDDYEHDASAWNEAAQTTLLWVLGLSETAPTDD